VNFPDRETLTRWLLTRDTPVFVQFVKYGACGVLATIVLVAIVMTLSATVLPALDHSLVDGEPISHALRQRNLILNNVIAFPFANLAAYLLNVWLVFTPGRHARWKEFGIFTLVSAISHFAGVLAGPFLIEPYEIPTLAAQLSLIITSALVNFLCRKFIVFEK
jgi:putative flippase GtrA